MFRSFIKLFCVSVKVEVDIQICVGFNIFMKFFFIGMDGEPIQTRIVANITSASLATFVDSVLKFGHHDTIVMKLSNQRVELMTQKLYNTDQFGLTSSQSINFVLLLLEAVVIALRYFFLIFSKLVEQFFQFTKNRTMRSSICSSCFGLGFDVTFEQVDFRSVFSIIIFGTL